MDAQDLVADRQAQVAQELQRREVGRRAQLVARGLVKDVADLYDLSVATLEKLPRMGKKSAENITKAVAQSRAATLTRLVTGLGIPSIGSVWAQKVAERYRSLDTLLATPPEEIRATLAAMHGFGDERASAVATFLGDPQGRALLAKLQERGVSPVEPEPRGSGGPLTGKTFCLTGTMTRPRDELKKRIEAAGGKVLSAVSGKTSYLVAGDKPGADKQEAAAKHGVPVLDEAGLLALLSPPVP